MNLTVDKTEEGSPILRVPEPDIHPTKLPVIPIKSEDALLDEEIKIRGYGPYREVGDIVGIKYYRRYKSNILQFKSAYVIKSIVETNRGKYTLRLVPTHGNSELLQADQLIKDTNYLRLERSSSKVRGGGKMLLYPVKTEHIIDTVGEIPEIMSQFI